MTDIKKRGDLKELIGRYSLWFIFFSAVCYIPFLFIFQRSFITADDGLSQQYVYFAYVGIWIRRLFDNLFVKHMFELPMWDMSIGMGSDSLLTLSGVTNVLADPFYWISALLPIRFTEAAFNTIVIIKLYLSGIAFSVLCRDKGRDIPATVTGAMIYTFSATISVGFRQAFFLNVFILFPLLILGCNRLWNNKGHRLYVSVLTISVVYSFYFSYMFGLLVIVYCIIRFITEKDSRNARRLMELLRRFIIFTVLALGIGIGPVLPSLISLSGLDRLNREFSMPLIDIQMMKDLFRYAFSYCNLWHESIWGFSSLVFIALLLLFRRKGQYSLLKILFIVYSISLCIPRIGSLMNGLSYPANRFVFGYSLLLAYIVTEMYGYIGEFKGKLFYASLAVASVYLAFGVFGGTVALLSGLSLLVTVLILGVANTCLKSERIKGYLFTGLLLLSSFFIAIARNVDSNYLFIRKGTAESLLLRYEEVLTDYDISQNRYDVVPYTYSDVPVNASMLMGLNGYDFYHSNYNNYVDRYFNEMGIVSNTQGYLMTGLRGRSFLEMLNGTEYILWDTGEDKMIRPPYMYRKDSSCEQVDVYRSLNGASMLFFYDDSVSYDSYSTLSPLEREELMMYSCVLEDLPDETSISMIDNHTEIEYDPADSEGCEYLNGSVTVEGDSGYISLTTPIISDQEISVYLDGLDHYGDYYYQFAVVLMDGDKAVAADFYVGADQDYDYYHGKNSLLFNFGVVDEEVDSVRLYFNSSGEYSLKDIKICTRSPEQLETITDAFYEHASIDDITYNYSGNHISILAEADRDKYLYLAVPYSDGWSAIVDGEDAEIIRANEAFMAIRLSEGQHNIEFSYQTPYLMIGTAISLLSIIVLCIFEMIEVKMLKKVVRTGSHDGNQGE